jgi:hypothetical protein
MWPVLSNLGPEIYRIHSKLRRSSLPKIELSELTVSAASFRSQIAFSRGDLHGRFPSVEHLALAADP